MEIRGKLLHDEIKEAGGFLRSRYHWPKLLLRSLYGVLLLLALVWGTVAKVVSGDRAHWLGLSVVWFFVATILVLAFFGARRSHRQDVKILNESLPDVLVFGEEGVNTQRDDGRKSFFPWTSVTEWVEGVSVCILKLPGRGSFLFIPLSDLTADDRRLLHGRLLGRLGSPREGRFT